MSQKLIKTTQQTNKHIDKSYLEGVNVDAKILTTSIKDYVLDTRIDLPIFRLP